MIIVDVFVSGAAKTKGSMEVRNRATGAMKESVVGSSRWRALMAQAVRTERQRRACTGGSGGMACDHRPPFACAKPAPWAGAVTVHVLAYLTCPRRGDDVHAHNHYPIWYQAGDLDKIVRNVLDALGTKSDNPKMNGGAIVDDNLVCRIVAEKRVADDRRPAGVRIIVETL